MRWTNQVRCWRWVGLCGLLCLAAHGLAIAQSDTAAVPAKSAHVSATPAKSHPTTSHGTVNHSSAHSSSHKGKSAHGKKVAKKHGQQAIDTDRAREIQTALIREHYMQGEPSGAWDSATQTAMQRYQADQGWQAKTTPDSRALIKLGLGPSHDHLLNPESAMTGAPVASDPKAGLKQKPGADGLPQD